jgi:glucose-6-phosphate dehydrogenase assembly protein OpcA
VASTAAAVTDDVWREQDTTPAKIEEALRRLLNERHAANEAYAPARVCNLVVIVDREWRGEIENRLERVGRYHPSRAVVCVVDSRHETLDAWATVSSTDDPEPGVPALVREHVEVEIGPRHLAGLDTIVDPILVADLATIVWSPHRHEEAVDALSDLADVVLLDSVEEPDVVSGLDRVAELAGRAYVVDLAWLRSTPWRERVSATFDPPKLRAELAQISGVTVRHHPESEAAALLFLGWLCSRLGWEPGALTSRGNCVTGRARGRKAEVALTLEPESAQSVPGLAGVTVETAKGTSISLDRARGGLRARRRERDGGEAEWTILGASRGEGGILGEGIRQALLRDPTYRPALDAARALAP